MNKTQLPNGQWQLDSADGHILHRIGSDDYTPLRHARVTSPDEWEEIPEAAVPLYTDSEYKTRVAALVHERYSVDDEIALAANAACQTLLADEARAAAFADEYAAYQTYRAECKARAKAELEARGATEVTETTK